MSDDQLNPVDEPEAKPTGQSYKAEFEITYDDYLVLCDAQERGKASMLPIPRWGHWLITAVIAIGGGILLAAGDTWFGGVLLVGVGVILLLEFVFVPLARRRSYASQSLEGMRVTLNADDGGFNMANEKADSRIAWSALKTVDHFRDHLVLWTSGRTGLVVPKRGFQSLEEADAFYAFAQKKSAEAAKHNKD